MEKNNTNKIVQEKNASRFFLIQHTSIEHNDNKKNEEVLFYYSTAYEGITRSACDYSP